MTIPGIGMYSASKAALNMLTKTMAIELGTHNIRVNAVAPAAVLAPLAVSYICSYSRIKTILFYLIDINLPVEIIRCYYQTTPSKFLGQD